MEAQEKSTAMEVPKPEPVSNSSAKIFLPGDLGRVIECYSNPFDSVCIPANLVERFTTFERTLQKDVKHLAHRNCVEYKCMGRPIAFVHFKENSIVAFTHTQHLLDNWSGEPRIIETPSVHPQSFSAVELNTQLDDLCFLHIVNIVAEEYMEAFHVPFSNPKESEDDEAHNGNENSDTLTSFHPLDLSGYSMGDIIGLQDVKEEIRRRVILPAQYPALFNHYGISRNGGILLYGPPGNGKTAIAKAIACEVDAKFFTASMSEIDSHWSGEAERNVRHLFEAAREYPLSIIFLDDFDSIGMKRSRLDDGNRSVILAELLIQMQGVRESGGKVIVIAATNCPWEIDSALLRPGRFDICIHVPLPDAVAREGIFRKNLEAFLPEETDFKTFAKLTEGYSGADIHNICERAKTDRVVRHIDLHEDFALTEADIAHCLSATKSSVDKEDVERCDAYSKGVRSFPRNTQKEDTYIIPKKAVRLKGYQ